MTLSAIFHHSCRMLGLSLAVLGLSSCCHLGSRLRVQANPDGYVPSLHTLFDRLDPHGGTLRILLVHGMNNHPFGDETQFVKKFGASATTYAALQQRLLQMLDARGPDTKEYQDLRASLTAAILGEQFPGLIEHMNKKLGKAEAEQDPSELTLFCHPASGPNRRVLGYDLAVKYREKHGGRRVEYHICSWALPVALHKEQVYGSVGDASHPGNTQKWFPQQASRVNRGLKEGLINWGLTDAAIYVGKERTTCQWTVAQSLAHAVDGLDAKKDGLAVVTHSLGSTITVDALCKLLTGSLQLNGTHFHWHKKQDGENLITMLAGCSGAAQKHGVCHDKPVPVYMFANQYQLLRYAEDERQADSGGGSSSSGLLKSLKGGGGGTTGMKLFASPAEQFTQLIKVDGDIDPRLKEALKKHHFQAQVVAFTDPEDLLSHPFGGIDKTATPHDLPSIGTTNVYVHNREMIFLGIMANPLTAHTGYQNNPAVKQCLFDGIPKKDIPE